MKNKTICIFLFSFLTHSFAWAKESYPHGSYSRGSYGYGSYSHNELSECTIERARFIECPEGIYRYEGVNHLINVNESAKKKIFNIDRSLEGDRNTQKVKSK